MKSLDCLDCGSSVRVSESFKVNERDLCEPCADKQVVEIQKAKGPLKVYKGVDETVCAKCDGDFGERILPTVAGMHVCESCRDSMLNFQFPAWLKTAFAALLLLLVVALVHGRSYFAAGRAFYHGKKVLAANHPEQAVPYFEEALKSGTASEEIIKYAALAYLKIPDPDAASKLIKGRSFKKDELYDAVDMEARRWERSNTKLEEVGKLIREKRFAEARSKLQEVVAAYPAAPQFALYLDSLRYRELFYAANYEELVRYSESEWKKQPDYQRAAGLAAAYACIWARSGDEAIKQKALDTMTQARSLAKSKGDQDDLTEWAPRFDHRIESRKIIDKEQYDALFRPELAKKREEAR